MRYRFFALVYHTGQHFLCWFSPGRRFNKGADQCDILRRENDITQWSHPYCAISFFRFSISHWSAPFDVDFPTVVGSTIQGADCRISEVVTMLTRSQKWTYKAILLPKETYQDNRFVKAQAYVCLSVGDCSPTKLFLYFGLPFIGGKFVAHSFLCFEVFFRQMIINLSLFCNC